MPRARVRSTRAPGVILLDGKAAVDPAAVQEIGAHAGAGAFGGNQDHVHVFRRDDAGLVVVDDGKAVREIQRIAFLQVRLDLRPDQLLPGIRDQVLDDRAALGGFFEREERLARHPAIFERLFPRLAAGSFARRSRGCRYRACSAPGPGPARRNPAPPRSHLSAPGALSQAGTPPG